METTEIPLKNAFQTIIDGKQTDIYFISNKHNIQASICDYGARWVSMQFPDHKGQPVEIIVGFNKLKDYQAASSAYYGATVGRYANRIAKGIFFLGNNTYKLPANNDINHLHGGYKGLHCVVWDVVDRTDNSVLFHHISPEGTEGYPGNLELFVRYTLTDENEMRIDYSATTDKETIINLTNHSYFNLNGGGSIENHLLTIQADSYTPTDSNMIPTGEILSVLNTPVDFRTPKAIDENISYDHNFVLRKEKENILSLAANVVGDISGIKMDVLTTEPGIQLYTSRCLVEDSSLQDENDSTKKNTFCLETQHFPNSPNEAHFPSVILKPGQQFSSTTIYRFSI